MKEGSSLSSHRNIRYTQPAGCEVLPHTGFDWQFEMMFNTQYLFIAFSALCTVTNIYYGPSVGQQGGFAEGHVALRGWATETGQHWQPLGSIPRRIAESCRKLMLSPNWVIYLFIPAL